MTEEEKETPRYCPNCGDEEINVRGKTESGSWIISCNDCDLDYLIRDVTGKTSIKIAVEGSPEA